MTKQDRIDEFETFLAEVTSAGWREADKVIREYMGSLEEDIFDHIFFSEEDHPGPLTTASLSSWLSEKIILAAISKYGHKSDRILKESELSQAKALILARGLYSEMSVLDYVARNDEGEVQYVAAQTCSVAALRDIVGAKSAKVRKVVFQRLGPAECLNMMLKDKMASVRREGVLMAPFGYEKLNDMTKEIARGPFSALVEKISSEYLPMLLANRNLSNKWICKKLETRLSLEANNV